MYMVWIDTNSHQFIPIRILCQPLNCFYYLVDVTNIKNKIFGLNIVIEKKN